jgi:ABC-2 type transport system permease protein
MSDLGTMIWKEAKEQFFQGGWGPWIRPLIVMVAIGVALPGRAGRPWLELPPPVLLLLIYVPFLLILSFIGDAMAGERERHTLETLLASRMPDRAILLGKVLVTVGYTWGISLAGLLLGAVTANLAGGPGAWAFYHPWDVFLEVVAASLLVSLLATSAGVLISLHAGTVRQAQQILAVGTIVLIFGGLLVFSVLPADLFAGWSYAQLLLVALAVLAVLDAVLLGIALLRFQRARLILS